MNASRPHTDGERHEGDTPTESMVTIAQPGVVVRSDDIQTAADLAAGIWVIQNRGRPEGEEDPLPKGVTLEDVERAIARQRREATRRAMERHQSRTVPRRDYLCKGGCGRSLSYSGLCALCTEPAVLLKEPPKKPEGMAFWQVCVFAALVAFVMVALCMWLAQHVPGGKPW